MNRAASRLGIGLALSGLFYGGAALAEIQESPQHFAFEVKFGPYSPHLDNVGWLNGRTPFSDHFGDPADPKGAQPHYGLLSKGEFDYQFWHKFGVLGIGIEGGYYTASAPAFTIVTATSKTMPPVTSQQPCSVIDGPAGGPRQYSVPGNNNLPYDSCISGDSDTLNVVPLALMLVYRFDVLSKRYHIPLIPYMKVGFAYYVWWFGTSSASTAQFDVQVDKNTTETRSAAGGSMGIVLHPGISLDLSAIDSRAARVIDQEIGLNRVAAFVELDAALVNGFGIGRAMNLSDTFLSAGLSFEF
ncbi:MAG TPA: MXAN_2562 family outer membrane beta-barrel protein [Pseudomonadota bacterium]|nr:MXAN_2562 family outer membrane beta-barrel protein [Pseudomonadota bacterium]